MRGSVRPTAFSTLSASSNMSSASRRCASATTCAHPEHLLGHGHRLPSACMRNDACSHLRHHRLRPWGRLRAGVVELIFADEGAQVAVVGREGVDVRHVLCLLDIRDKSCRHGVEQAVDAVAAAQHCVAACMHRRGRRSTLDKDRDPCSVNAHAQQPAEGGACRLCASASAERKRTACQAPCRAAAPSRWPWSARPSPAARSCACNAPRGTSGLHFGFRVLGFFCSNQYLRVASKNRPPVQMCLLCPEVALDIFRHEQLEGTAEIKRLQRAMRGRHLPTPTRTRLRPFRSSGLLSCTNCILLTTCAERGGLSRVVRGPTTSQEQGGSCPPASLQDLSGPEPSFQASIILF